MLVMNYFQDFIFGIDLQNSFLTFVRLADCFSSINSASTIFYFQELNQEMKTLPETDDNLLEDFVHFHYP